MEGWMVCLLYIVAGVCGFGGGVFGYFFAKYKDKKAKEKSEKKLNEHTVIVNC